MRGFHAPSPVYILRLHLGNSASSGIMATMRITITLATLLLLITGLSAYAGDTTVRGEIGKGPSLPEATLEQYEESMAVTDSCKAYNYTNIHYDCDCMGMKFLELRLSKGPDANAFWLKEEAKRKCPNVPEVAGLMYSRCLHWAPTHQGENYEEFCTCYGNEFAKIYSTNPDDNQLVVEDQMIRALGKCNVNAQNERKQDLKAFVERMKKDGNYDVLFPGASESK